MLKKSYNIYDNRLVFVLKKKIKLACFPEGSTDQLLN